MTKPIQKISLVDFFKFKAPTHLLGTTFTVSLMFFESAVWPHIDKSALQRCLILCDREGFRRATCEAVGLKEVSSSYMAIPVPTKRTFHSKFWIVANDDEVSFLIGSGNLTQSGFMDNNELFDVVSFDQLTSEPALVDDVNAFLAGLRNLFIEKNNNDLWVRETISQISELLINTKKTGSSHWTLRLLHSFNSTFPDELAKLSPGEHSHLYVAAPYFGNNVDGLALLRESINPKKITVCPAVESTGETNFNADEAENLGPVEVVKLNLGKDGALSHFKLYGIVNHSGEGVLFNGSVNCTYAAMSAENIEAGLARRVSANDVEYYFADREPLAHYTYKRLSIDGHAGERWIVLYAISGGDNLELYLPATTTERDLPLVDVEITVRRENEIALLAYDRLFSHACERILISWNSLKNLAANTGATYVELIGKDSSGARIRGGNFVNDLYSLSSSPAHRNAFRAALKIAGGDAIPSIFDISSLFVFLEETALETHANKPNAGSSGSKETNQSERPRSPAVPVWPPQAVKKGDGNQFGTGDVSVSWFQRILHLIFDTDSEEPIDIGTDDDNGKKLAPPEKKDSSLPARTELEKTWDRAQAQFRQLRNHVQSGDLSPAVIPRVVPGVIAGAWVILGTRRKILSVAKENGLVGLSIRTLENYLPQFLDLVFGPSVRGRCLANIEFEECGVALHQDFSRIFLLFFAYLYALAQRNPNQRFPLDLWVVFVARASGQFESIASEPRALKRVYETFLFSVDSMAWESLHQSVAALLGENWQSLPGMKALKYLRSYGPECIRQEPAEIAKTLGDDGLVAVRNLARRGTPLNFCSAKSNDRFCIAPRCCMIEEPSFDNLRKMLPVVCLRCGAIMVPEALLFLERGAHE